MLVWGGSEPSFFHIDVFVMHFFIGVTFMVIVALIEMFVLHRKPGIPFSQRYGKGAFWFIVIFWFLFEVFTSQGFRAPTVSPYMEVARTVYEAPAAIAGFYLANYLILALFYFRTKAGKDARVLLDQHIPPSEEVIEGHLAKRSAGDYAHDAVSSVTKYDERKEAQRQREGKDALDWLDKKFDNKA